MRSCKDEWKWLSHRSFLLPGILDAHIPPWQLPYLTAANKCLCQRLLVLPLDRVLRNKHSCPSLVCRELFHSARIRLRGKAMSVCEKIEFKDYFRIWQRKLDTVLASCCHGLATNSGINAWINKSVLEDRYFFKVKIAWSYAFIIIVDSAYVDVPCLRVNHSLMLFVGSGQNTLLIYHRKRIIHWRRWTIVADADN